MWACNKCGWRTKATIVYPVHCRCGLIFESDTCDGIKRPTESSENVAPHQSGSILSRYAIALDNWLAAGSPVRTDEQVAAILAICHDCEHYNPKRKSCRLCGCRVNISKVAPLNKIRMATESCPDDPPKW